MIKNVPSRSEILPEDRWDVESIFPDDASWRREYDAVAEALHSLDTFRGHLRDSSARLADWFTASEALEFRAAKITLYASMKHNVDTTDQAAAGLHDLGRSLAARLAAAVSFAEPELIEIGFVKLHRWLTEEPRLAIYAHYFDRLERRVAHVRSGEVEELLGALSDPFRTASATHGILADADLSYQPACGEAGETFEITQGTIEALRTHSDRSVRRTAFQNYTDAFISHKNTIANCIAGGVKQDVFRARARRYASSLEAALEPNFIPVEVFHNLIQTFRANLPTWHRYWRIRRRALGYGTLHVYDEKAPLTDTRPSIEFAQAVDWICRGLEPLGNEYVSTARCGLLERRWVDKYPSKGKRAGAFSTGAADSQPFILMSFNNDFFSMSTLAHELGHSMHRYFTQKIQPFVYHNCGIFLAETASNFNQAMVRAWLLKNADLLGSRSRHEKTEPASAEGIHTLMSPEKFQIAVIEEAMSNFHRYLFLMPTLARFEFEIHRRAERGMPLTAPVMTELLADLFEEGYGGEVVVDRERVGIIWAQFATHLYSNFYVYQYATGISGAHALAQDVLQGRPGAVENYLRFLSSGGSQFPLEALRCAGVDLTTPAPVQTTFDILARYLDRLEELLGLKSNR